MSTGTATDSTSLAETSAQSNQLPQQEADKAIEQALYDMFNQDAGNKDIPVVDMTIQPQMILPDMVMQVPAPIVEEYNTFQPFGQAQYQMVGETDPMLAGFTQDYVEPSLAKTAEKNLIKSLQTRTEHLESQLVMSQTNCLGLMQQLSSQNQLYRVLGREKEILAYQNRLYQYKLMTKQYSESNNQDHADDEVVEIIQ